MKHVVVALGLVSMMFAGSVAMAGDHCGQCQGRKSCAVYGTRCCGYYPGQVFCQGSNRCTPNCNIGIRSCNPCANPCGYYGGRW